MVWPTLGPRTAKEQEQRREWMKQWWRNTGRQGRYLCQQVVQVNSALHPCGVAN